MIVLLLVLLVVENGGAAGGNWVGFAGCKLVVEGEGEQGLREGG